MSDLATARVLLIGTGRHRSGSGMPDVPAVATTLRDLRKSLIERCGVGRDSISIIIDPVNPMVLGEALASAAEQATDILIVYYVGHGLVSSDSALYLATRSTDYRPSRIEHTALPYRTLRTYVRDCPALSKIVILDCCWAGLAFEALGDSTQLADLSRIEGTFVLTSAGPDEAALAPPDRRHTEFSGALLRLLELGDPQVAASLTLDSIYRWLRDTLRAEGKPVPQRRSTGRAGELVISANPAYKPPPPTEPEAVEPGRSDAPDVDGPRAAPDGRTGLRRRLLLAAASVTIALAGGIGGWHSFSDWAAAGCAGTVHIRVGVPAELFPVLNDAAADWARSAREHGKCVRAEVVTSDPGDVAAAVAARHGKTLAGLARTGTDPGLTVWIPDSSLWLSRLRAIDNTAVPAESQSVASTPIVLAVPQSKAEDLGWASRAPSWATIVRSVASTADVVGGTVEPSYDTPALLTLNTISNTARSAQETAGIIRSFAAGRSTLRDELVRHFPRTDSDDSSGVPLNMAPLPEQVVRSKNAAGHAAPLMGVRPTPFAPSLDYPFVILPVADANAVAAAHSLQRALAGSAWRERLRVGLFEPPVSLAGWSRQDVADADRIMATWLITVRPSQILLAVDTSATMARPVPTAGGATRLQVVRTVITKAMALLDDRCAMGLWSYGNRIDGTRNFRELVPVGPLDQFRSEIAEALDRLRTRSASSTGLYETIDASYRMAQDQWQPYRTNMVIVVTDNGHDSHPGMSLSGLVNRLRRAADPKHPVRLLILGIGQDTASSELTTIAQATGGDLFVSKDPAKAADVMLEMISSSRSGKR